VDQGTGTFRYGGSNGAGLNYRVYGMGFTRGPEFHADPIKLSTIGEWPKPGFVQTGTRISRDTLTLQGDIYHEIAGKPPRLHCILRLLKSSRMRTANLAAAM